MLNAHRNVELDAKANRLKLRPTKPQTNIFSRNFTVEKAKTDAEIVAGERICLCIELRNRRRK